MVSESDTTQDRPANHAAEAPAESLRVRRRRVKVRRKQDKFPKPLRVLLLIGVPILLWTGIYMLASRLM